MKRLIEIQNKLKAPKNQYNSFGKYNYRSCEDILEGVKPLLKETGLALIITDEIISLDGRFYVKATASLFDNDGKTVASTSALAREEETKKGMDGSQVTGASSSYARKYALNGLFAIDDTKDADSTNTHDKKEVAKPINPDEKIINALKEMLTTESAHQFYKMNETKVKDAEAFKKVYAQVYSNLMKKEKQND